MNPINRRIDAAVLVTAVMSAGLCAADFAWPNPALSAPGHDPKPWGYSLPVAESVVSELEPNDDCVFNAQQIGRSVAVTDAQLDAPGDVDYYAMTLEAGEVMTVATRSPADGHGGGHSGYGIDTILEILADDCQTVLASDDDTGPDGLAFIPRFVADRSGVYFIRVTGYEDESGEYRLDAFGGWPPQGHGRDRCSPQFVVNPCSQSSTQGSMTMAINDYDPGSGSCVPYGAAGRDVAFGIPLAAGDRLIVDYFSEADGVVYLLTDCEDPSGSCVAGADDHEPNEHHASSPPQTSESLDFMAPVDGLYYLIFDSYGADTGANWNASYVIECGEPRGACCIVGPGPGALGECVVVTPADCAMSGGVYHGDGAGCDPDPCAPAPGACCIFAPGPGMRSSVPGAVCVVQTPADCANMGGVYYGAGVACDPDLCAPPTDATGACCLEGNFCVVAQLPGCNMLNGSYQGDGTTCDPDRCMPSVPTESITWGGLKNQYR